jgi:hypothetical protein
LPDPWNIHLFLVYDALRVLYSRKRRLLLPISNYIMIFGPYQAPFPLGERKEAPKIFV